MNTTHKFSVAILAGGQSKRFGSNKQAAFFRGTTLLQRAYKTAKELSSQVFFIANHPTNLAEMDLPVYSDIYKGKGPLAGIHSALVHSPTDLVAIMPVDMPLLTAGVYRFLLPFLTNEHPVVAESEKGLEPLVSIWHAKQSNFLKHRLEKEKLSIFRCVEALDGKKIAVHLNYKDYDPKLFANINYPEDLAQLL